MRRPALTRTLFLVLLLDLMLQGYGLWRSVDVNPSLQHLAGDAEEYWNLAGDIADGQLVAATPFLSAPLYPYFVGLIRALGGGMLSVYLLQLLMRSLTAWLLAKSANRLFGHLGFGLATAVTFLWLQEPAYYAVRLLNSSLQLLTLSALVYACIAWRNAFSTKRLVGLGALLGVSILSNPGLLITLPFFAWWLGLRPTQLKQTGIAMGIALLCILPATLHNAIATSDSEGGTEFILLSAQAGVTFAHGNSDGAVGTYKPLKGVSMNRAKQNADAYRRAAEATGEPGWTNTSSYFFGQGLDYLLANPTAAIVLEFAKLRWFFCGRNYGDLYQINLENSDPEWPRQVPLPGGLLELSWILPAAFFGLVLLIRRDRKHAIPLAALLVGTLFVVLVFWYSPRYRLPAAPLAALLAPWAVFEAARLLKCPRQWILIATLAILPAAMLEGCSLVTHFDPLEDARAQYDLHIGLQRLQDQDFTGARPRLEAALAGGEVRADVHSGIAECLVQEGTAFGQLGERAQADALFLQAVEHYRSAVKLNPTRLDAGFSLGSVLFFLQQMEEARAVVQTTLVEAERQNNPEMVARLRRILAQIK